MEQTTRPARKVAIADHIWEAFEEMAQTMGSDRDGLINQAMFMFARLNGFLDSPAPPNGTGQAARSPARSNPPVLAPVGRGGESLPGGRSGAPRPEDDPARREVAERVLETAAELERLIKGKNQPQPSLEESEAGDDVGDELPDEAGEDAGEDGGLYLMSESGELDRIVKDRFVIGRGKHCDFVINSGKVSREHAAIVREGDTWFVEDLGSSNGTWFQKQRIKRRKIEDGDEYFICSEKVKFVFR